METIREFFAERIRESHNQVVIDRAMYFFSMANSEADAELFSFNVHLICDNPRLSKDQKVAILVGSVRQHAGKLTASAVKNYLESIEQDVLLIKTLYRHFDELPTPVGAQTEVLLPSCSAEVEITRKVLWAMKVVTPEMRADFARLALKKFPNFPGRDRETGRIYGFRWYLSKIAGYSSYNGGDEKAKIPLPVPFPIPVVKQVESQAVFGSSSKKPDPPFLPEHLLRLPKTPRNKRKIEKYIESTVAVKPHRLRATAR